MQTDEFKSFPMVGILLASAEVAVDYKVVSPYKGFIKNVHIGYERKVLRNMIKLRGGINQGYTVGGFGWDLKFWKIPLLHIDYAQYVRTPTLGFTGKPLLFHALEVGVLF